MLNDDIHSFFGQFIHEEENRSQVLNLVTQQMSEAEHTMRTIYPVPCDEECPGIPRA